MPHLQDIGTLQKNIEITFDNKVGVELEGVI